MQRCKVLQFICPTGLYGAEMWILALAKNLNREKVDCELAVTHEFDGQNLALCDRYEELDLPAYKLEMSGRFDPSAILGLCSLIKQRKFDIIHTHGYKSDLLGLIAAKITGIKAVSTAHGFENARDAKLKIFIRLGCLALRYFDRIAPLSEELERDLLRLRIPRDKIRLIQNGVDIDEIRSAEETAFASLFPPVVKKIGYVGQLISRKNLIDLLKAYDLFFSDHEDSLLIVVGDGSQKEELESCARSLKSSSHIQFLGYRKDRLRVLREMDVFTMTSSLEGIPRCMMEAMCMGVPVAAYDIPGVDKLIIPDVTGISVPFGDPIELKRGWERLFRDGVFRSRLADNAKQHILTGFSAAGMAEQYTELYRQLTLERMRKS